MNNGRASTLFCTHAKQRKTLLTLCIAIMISLGLSACSRYQMTLNEAVVYTPPSALTDFTTQDSNLQGCLDQMIKDRNITALKDVTQLICSHAGLTSLKGIEVFYNLRQVNLEHNQLTSIAPMKHLSKLEVLLLNDNQLTEAPELLTMAALKQLKLGNNPSLACGDLLQLKANSDADLQLPEQCQ